MTGMSGIRLALTLGLALSLLVGAGTIVATPASPAPATTRDTSAASEPNMEPWPSEDALATEVSRYPGRDDPNNVTIALAARWGYLNDPAVIALAGRWQFNSANTCGEFVGEWRLVAHALPRRPHHPRGAASDVSSEGCTFLPRPEGRGN